MRTNRTAIGMGLVGIALMAGLMSGIGCSNLAEDCEERRRPCDGGSGMNAGGSGGDGGIPGCEDSPIDNPAVIKYECGVFVRSDAATGGDGTKATPFQSIGEAVAALPSGKRLYVCGGQTFAETVVLPGGVELYGGLNCADESWTYQGGQAAAQSVIAPAAGGDVPLTLQAGGGETLVYGVHATAPAGVDPGQSSIAAIVADGGAAMLEDCALTAGDGVEGAEGTTPAGTGMAGEPGNEGKLGCTSAEPLTGGGSKTSMCTVDESSTGGPGGNGDVGVGGAGSPGTASPVPPDPVSNGGAGQTDMLACTVGAAGAPGANGTPGMGGAGLGAISSAGYAGVPGMPGMAAGKPGQGGGGGGGARGATVCIPNAGPSGGGGGSGGCGGTVGNGGGPGGSSLGLLSLSATVSLKNVRIKVGNGGLGGAGSNGQPGGSGGVGGTPATGSAGACSGGQGGQGGRGGAAGGGVGGHAIAVAYTVTAPDQAEVNITKGVAGVGGPGGDGGMMNQGLAGADGVSMERQSFD